MQLEERAQRLVEQAQTALRGIKVRVAGEARKEPDLIREAAHGTDCRQILESAVFREFWARSEAKLTTEMLALPLADDGARRRLAEAIQTQRSLSKWLLESAQAGKAAERELERLRTGRN